MSSRNRGAVVTGLLLEELIGESAAIAELREQVQRLVARHGAARRLPHMLLAGETGTGKGLLARALHDVSPRRKAPFVDVNCAAIPDNLLEAELFGVERGAYTGADRSRAGLFQSAQGGTLFLDEIALLPTAVQGKLLKALEDRTVRRVGSTRTESVDVWILAATNEDLDEAMRTGRFRRDLYHRLAVVTLRLPPLRERGSDVIRLAEHFLARACADYELPPRTLAKDARSALRAHGWPGNVRELANLVERVALLSEGSEVTAAMLELPPAPDDGPAPAADEAQGGLRAVVGATERERLVEALEATGWNLSHAAARLQVPRNTLRYRMERHGLREPPPSRRPQKPRAVTEQRRIALLRVALIAPPHGAEAHVQRAHDAVIERIHAFGGRVEEVTPGAMVAAFGLVPVEDAPRRAALAAIAARKAVERARLGGGPAMSVAAAIHVDSCGVATSDAGVELDRDDRGAAWSVLEAMVETARPDGVLVSEAAATSLRRRFELGPAIPLGGAAGCAYRWTGGERAGFGPTGRATEFVGRRQELALLQSRVESVRDGQGHVVAIIGDAGIGKSRLLVELRQRLLHDEVGYLEGRCTSYGASTPYLPALEILRRGAGIEETDGPPAVAEKLEPFVGTSDTPEDHASYLLPLLAETETTERLRDVNPELMKARTFDAFRHFVLARARRGPIVVAIEDLHWIDKTSDELLTSLVDSIRSAAILVVVTYRPGYVPAWLARPYVTQLALPPLSADESRAVIRSAVHAEEMAKETTDLILRRGEGNPFFLEELAHVLHDGVAAEERQTVPETIHAVLATRIERLEAGERRLLQTAAVIGRDVPAVVLEAIAADGSANVRACLRQLQAADFLWETRPGEYTFKHALTHQVAYATLAPERRRELHAKVARLEHRPELIARHLTAADLLDEAIPLWLEAGRNAVRRSASVEAVSHFSTAIVLLERRPPTPARARMELDLQLALAPALAMTRGYAAAEVAAVYARAQTLCERLGDSPESFSALWGIWVFHVIRGEMRAARATGERLLAVARRAGNADLLVEAHLACGVPLIYQGHLADARRHIEEGLALYDPERHSGHAYVYGQDTLVGGLGFLGWALMLQGHERDALASVARALGHAEGIGHAFSRAVALYFAGLVNDLRGDYGAMLGYAERLIAVAEEHHFPLWRAGGLGLRGRALAAQGRHAEGLELMAAGLDIWRSTSAGAAVTYFLRNIAEAYRAVGAFEQALAAVTEGLTICDRNDNRSGEPELHRVRAELLARDPATSDQAEESFRHAVTVAGTQGSVLFARRAAAAFAAYLRERGRVAEAERVLAEAPHTP